MWNLNDGSGLETLHKGLPQEGDGLAIWNSALEFCADLCTALGRANKKAIPLDCAHAIRSLSTPDTEGGKGC